MNPLNILWQTMSNLTGGLIGDVTSLVVGLCTIGFLVMAIDILSAPLQARIKESRFQRELEEGYDDYAKRRLKQDTWKNRYEQDKKDLGL